MIEYLLFAVSSALVLLATNLDNLAVLLGLMLSLPRRVAVAGFWVAQGIVLAVAYVAATGASDAFAARVGYLGAVPVALGLWQLWSQWRAPTDDAPALDGKRSLGMVVALFLSLSVDSLLVMTPLLADSSGGFRLAALVGAAGMAALAGGGAAWLFAPGGALPRVIPRLERLAPVIMILAGLYVLSNTGTDVVP